MSRAIACLLIALVACVSPQTVASDPDCAALQEEVVTLTKRVEALEAQLKEVRATKQAPKPKPQARSAPDPLYAQIDQLLANGKIEEAQQALATKKATGEQSSWLNTLTREMAVVGKPTPGTWGIEKWYQGESEVDLEKGTTLLIFWESWCPHCRNEVPRLQKIYDQYKGTGLQVLGLTRITKTATEESVLSFISENKIGYPIAKETGAVVAAFNVKGIPAAAVIRDGTIIWRGHPARLTEEMLKQWM